MDRTTLSPKALDQIGEEHEILAQLYERILQSLDAGPRCLPATADLVDELAEKLALHFTHEEDGGYYSHVIDVAPWRANAVDALKQQHADLLTAIERIADGIRLARQSPIWWAAIQQEFAAFLRRCADHESRENRLVQEVYVLDVAAAD